MIPLGQRVLPKPLRQWINRRFLTAPRLSQCEGYDVSDEKKDNEQKRTTREVRLNGRFDLFFHLGHQNFRISST